ncbi:MAG: hypothetical protein IPK58_00005, partial [Acidobacteria bacterium]|nr:hypothetical protein [Acidobacteriota bacterium]
MTNFLHKKSTTAYNLDTAYVSRRIIGLPSKTISWGYNQSTTQLEKVSEVDYFYDEGDFSDTNLEQNISSVIMHDTANYGASFTVGRGNLTTSTRYDVTGATASVSSQIKYNIAGAPVAQITPWTTSSTRTTKISYADSFNDTSTTRNTYAYPTKLYDPAGNYSEVKYRFDTVPMSGPQSGARRKPTGKETTREYDSVGRLLKEHSRQLRRLH